MKKALYLLTTSLALFVFLSACSITTLQSTPTATPSDTPTLTATYTLAPSKTPTAESTLVLGDTEVISDGGYSFRPPVGYKVGIDGSQMVVSDAAGTLFISFMGDTSNPQNLSAEQIADEFLVAVFKRGDGEYEEGPAYAIEIDGIEGLSYDLTGTLFGSPLHGQAVVVMPSSDQYLFGLGISNTSQDEKQWENKGSKVFTALVNSIQFLSSGDNAESPCVVSTDATYGYTRENPIKVGGGDFGGPPRERAYLDNLLGPNGEKISYERNGSFGFGDTILDEFTIKGLSQSVILYIDEYSYTAPEAPVGFTCSSVFPFATP